MSIAISPGETMTTSTSTHALEYRLQAERARLVRLCASLTGNQDAAEDLAQETLLEAWRNLSKLRDVEGLPLWLSGIARNVCLRWARARGRQLARQVELRFDTFDSDTPDDPLTQLIDDFNLEIELERKELVELLDRALALLPPDVRMILIKRYVDDAPLNELAADMGINPGAATMRLQRGKLALRRVLTTHLQREIAPYIINPTEEAWETTSIWCPFCGLHRLLGKYCADQREIIMKCPRNLHNADECFCLHMPVKGILEDVKAYRPAFTRLLNWGSGYVQRNDAERSVPCLGCGNAIYLEKGIPSQQQEQWKWTWLPETHGYYCLCHHCSSYHWLPLPAFILTLPECKRFWQEHPRMRVLPEQQVEADGRAALVTRYESVTSQHSLAVVFAADTLEVLRIH